MAISLTSPGIPDLVYPESDGKPMADNTRQFQCITTIEGGIEALFRHDPDVFVAGYQGCCCDPVDNRTQGVLRFGDP